MLKFQLPKLRKFGALLFGKFEFVSDFGFRNSDLICMNPFDTFLIQPILNLLIVFYQLLSLFNTPWALGFAIIFLTAAIRLALWPLTASQLKSSQKMAALKPHLERIKKEHAHDKIRHQQEITNLYKEHGVNPVAGCLPLLLQIPIFIALYQVLLKIVSFGQADFLTKINGLLYFPALHLKEIPDTNFLGFGLADKPSQWSQIGFFILMIPILTGIFQYIQSKMLIPRSAKLGQGNQKGLQKAQAKKESKESMEDTMAAMQSQMTLIMPVMIAFFSYGFPVGLSLYWNTFTLIGIGQQYMISGAGELNKYLPKKWQKQS